jgi:hypothetical protein
VPEEIVDSIQEIPEPTNPAPERPVADSIVDILEYLTEYDRFNQPNSPDHIHAFGLGDRQAVLRPSDIRNVLRALEAATA